MARTNLKNHLALLAVNVIYAINYIAAKEVMPSVIGPFGFILLRVLPSTLAFFAICLLWGSLRIAREDLPRLILCGLTGVAINQLCFFKGLSLTSPIHASLMMIVTPVLVFLLSLLLLREKPGWMQMLGVALAGLGAFLLLFDSGPLQLSSDGFAGDIYIAINAFSYGLFLVLAKPLMKKYNPLTVISWVFLFGLLPVIYFGYDELMLVQWKYISGIQWLCILFIVILVTFVAYLLNVWALKTASPVLVGVYIYVQPLLAAFLAILVQEEKLSWIKIVSALLIFSGVFLVSLLHKIVPRNPSGKTAAE